MCVCVRVCVGLSPISASELTFLVKCVFVSCHWGLHHFRTGSIVSDYGLDRAIGVRAPAEAKDFFL
jgi:hypothetical protein